MKYYQCSGVHSRLISGSCYVQALVIPCLLSPYRLGNFGNAPYDFVGTVIIVDLVFVMRNAGRLAAY